MTVPKYSLTEDDKKLLSSIELVGYGLDVQFVRRNSNGYLGLQVNDKTLLFLNDELLKCVKRNEQVSLDELRKCL